MLWNDDNHLWQVGDRAQHLFYGHYATVLGSGRKYLHLELDSGRIIRTMPHNYRFVGTVVL